MFITIYFLKFIRIYNKNDRNLRKFRRIHFPYYISIRFPTIF
ncbi:hypothetical protein HMPREF9442_03417 [Paraprevotella xylaniphila YIT 11841]|uniref:Uncharacterized protein n=1 Tax=Paraprevotella xylaniphila YIT 11841 TaxID=762982 RepID=F3QYX3_9BACT|nr:hypothetical protein HMPREF9442_03417 [Paraprevotella xylaniphila YIT 11841]